jgi:hypothetical protein
MVHSAVDMLPIDYSRTVCCCCCCCCCCWTCSRLSYEKSLTFVGRRSISFSYCIHRQTTVPMNKTRRIINAAQSTARAIMIRCVDDSSTTFERLISSLLLFVFNDVRLDAPVENDPVDCSSTVLAFVDLDVVVVDSSSSSSLSCARMN